MSEGPVMRHIPSLVPSVPIVPMGAHRLVCDGPRLWPPVDDCLDWSIGSYSAIYLPSLYDKHRRFHLLKGFTFLFFRYQHRITTIMNYDVIVVLDEGRLAECGPPGQLLQREGGIFASFVHSNET